MCELLVGLPEVTVLDVTDIGDRLRVTVETERNDRRVRGCEASVVVKDWVVVELTDLPCFGAPAVLAWRISVHRPRSHARTHRSSDTRKCSLGAEEELP